MTWGHEIVKQLAWQSKPFPICRSCLSALQSRHSSAAASPVETAPIEPPPSGQTLSPLTASQSHTIAYKLRASVILSRPPLLTRTLTPFEKAYFLYQRRLNERLALPFTRYFYYSKGTPGDIEWKRKIKERKSPARDIGAYSGYGDEAWNDELMVGSNISEPEEQIEALRKDAEVEVKEMGGEGEVVRKEEVERPMPRITEADQTGDLQSLNRRLERTLFLVVNRGKGEWVFPNSFLESESLHTAAERIIVQTGGVNMNTWVVGNMPIGHQVYNYAQPSRDKVKCIETRGEKIFFMKARIMAGQANLKGNPLGFGDFRWLAKEEVKDALRSRDWNAVKNILPER